MSGRHTFGGVDVGLPSKVRGSEAEEEWQEVDWVSWSTGDLAVDGDSFLLQFKPSGGSGNVKAKPLGSLLRASSVSSDEDGRTFVVTTSDVLHRLLRFTFQSAQNAAEFARLATAAEAANAAAAGSGDSGAAGSAAAEAAAAKLEAELREKFADRWPLIFSGCELFGPDPNSQGGDEVLLGHGAAVLLDPPEDCKSVGLYELLFFGEDEGAQEPVKRLQIGPKMLLTKQTPEEEDEDGPAVSYVLAAGMQGVPAHTIGFDSASVGAAFARDFRVRQRLMGLSLKTVKRGHAEDALRCEIEGLKSQTLVARLRRFLCFAMLLVMLAVAARMASLYAKDKGARQPAEYIAEVRREARVALELSRSAASTAGAKACELAFGTVAAGDVRRCAALLDGSRSVAQASRCLEALAGRATRP